MKKLYFVLMLGFFFLCSSFLLAQGGDALGLKIGSKGIGLDFTKSLSSSFNVGVGFSAFGITVDGGDKNKDEYTYEAKSKLLNFTASADWFPFESKQLRLTGGLIFNLNDFDTKLTPTKTYTIGGDTYTPEDLGNLDAKIDFNKIAPYIGIGYGNPTVGDSGFKFTVDVGTFYQGGALVDLSAQGLLEPSAAEDQEKQLEDNLSWFKWYPVITIGLNYKF